MPVAAARPIVLTASERHRLKKAAYGHKIEHQARQRATVVLHAARGCSNARIARETGLHIDTVRTWRGRFAHGGLPALADRKRSGRPARFTPVQVAEAKALACQKSLDTLTASAWADSVAWSGEGTDQQTVQDETGRLWDVLWMTGIGLRRRRNPAILRFPVELHRVPRDGRSRTARNSCVVAEITGGDNGSPVLTVSQYGQD